MEDCWIFCNKCSLRYEPTSKMVLTDCAHIFCEKCVYAKERENKDANANKAECSICKKEVEIMELNDNMNEHTKGYFKDIVEECSELSQIIQFQNNQLLLTMNNLYKKYHTARAACVKQQALRQKTEIELNKWRNWRHIMDTRSSSTSQKRTFPNRSPFMTSTPISKINKVNTSGMSSSPFLQPKLPGYAHRINQDSLNSIQTVPNSSERLNRGGLPQPHHNTSYYENSINKRQNVPSSRSTRNLVPQLHSTSDINESLKKKKYGSHYLYSQYNN